MAPISSTLTRVLVTGFGPFQGVPNNPSWAIASRLPTTLPNNISLTVYPSAVPVAYHPVIHTIPDLIASTQPDLSLHIGVAEGRTYFAVEQTSRRGVYGSSWSEDIDGEVFTSVEEEEVWGGEPSVLSTDIDLQAVVDKWQDRTAGIVWPSAGGASVAGKLGPAGVDVKLRENVWEVEAAEGSAGKRDGGDDVRWSDSVGTYLCAFIYYTSMVEMERGTVGERRDTAFMHVPMLESEAEIQMGVEVTVELVQSLVETWRAQRAEEKVA